MPDAMPAATELMPGEVMPGEVMRVELGWDELGRDELGLAKNELSHQNLKLPDRRDRNRGATGDANKPTDY